MYYKEWPIFSYNIYNIILEVIRITNCFFQTHEFGYKKNGVFLFFLSNIYSWEILIYYIMNVVFDCEFWIIFLFSFIALYSCYNTNTSARQMTKYNSI